MAAEPYPQTERHSVFPAEASDDAQTRCADALSPSLSALILQCDQSGYTTGNSAEELFSECYNFRTATEHLSA
jgi:hypothetical protein